MPPHLHGRPLDPQPVGDVLGAHRVTDHGLIMDCSPSVDKCSPWDYSQDMRNEADIRAAYRRVLRLEGEARGDETLDAILSTLKWVVGDTDTDPTDGWG